MKALICFFVGHKWKYFAPGDHYAIINSERIETRIFKCRRCPKSKES